MDGFIFQVTHFNKILEGISQCHGFATRSPFNGINVLAIGHIKDEALSHLSGFFCGDLVVAANPGANSSSIDALLYYVGFGCPCDPETKPCQFSVPVKFLVLRVACRGYVIRKPRYT